jgi:hypothetical protein
MPFRAAACFSIPNSCSNAVAPYTFEQARAEFQTIAAHLAAGYPDLNAGETATLIPVLDNLVSTVRGDRGILGITLDVNGRPQTVVGTTIFGILRTVRVFQILMSWSLLGNGRGCSRMPSVMLNIALVAPMPRPVARMAEAASAGLRRSMRSVNRRLAARLIRLLH